MSSSDSQKPVFWKDFTAGYISGIVNVISGQPFDNTKVKMVGTKNSFLKTISTTIKRQGVLSLWAGSSFPIICFGFCNSICFSVNEQFKQYFRSKKQNYRLGLHEFFISGAMAGLANSIISSPMEHLRIRMAVDVENKFQKSSWKCFTYFYQNYGIKGLYRGMVITAFREFFLYGAYFAAYSGLRQWGERSDVLWMMFVGGMGGVSGWMGGFAFDNIKTRYQTDDLSNLKYKSWRDLKPVLKFSKLTEGFSAGFIRGFPVNALTFYSFELAMNFFYKNKSVK